MLSRQAGFTLIEMSIVLVIIGLIVGGVMVGQTLIAAAAIRAQVTQFEKFNHAVNAFRSKYDCLPGDCANATQFLTMSMGGFSGNGNGNGNGVLEDRLQAAGAYPGVVDTEPTYFWYHLGLAGMAECCSTLPASNVAGPYTIGQNFPQSKIGSAGISVLSLNSQNGYFLGITNNTSGGTLADQYSSFETAASLYSLSPAQAQAIDNKIDDGAATTGSVYAAWVYGGDNRVHALPYRAIGPPCVATAAANSPYGTSTQPYCDLFVRMQGN